MAGRVSAGDLTFRLHLERPTETPNGRGGVMQGWTRVMTCAAHVRFLRGSETVIAARMAGRQPVVLTVRDCADARGVTVDWRAVDARSGAVYAVKADPVSSQDRHWLEIMAEGGVQA